MKTKKFFMLLAAVLLMSASAMAQSSEPVRGDLNGDGEVNMSDVMFLVQKILNGKFPDEGETSYKYYAGVTDKVSFTESDLNQTTTTKPTTLTFGAAYGDNYQTFVYPASWGKPTSMTGWFWGDEAEMESLPSGYTAAIHQGGAVTYTITSWGNNDPIRGDLNGDGKVGMPDIMFIVQKVHTGSFPDEGETTYKYYAGVTDKVSFTESDLNQTSTTKPTTLTFGAAYGDNYQTFVYPASWGKPTSMMAGGLDGKDGWFWGDEAEMESLPSGYTAAIHQGGPVTYEITW